jgi:hypothetical protein
MQKIRIRCCIYCGGSPTTKEDIIPRRFQKLFDNGGNKSYFDTGYGHDAAGNAVYQSTHLNAGAALARRPKIVCAPCNNGWMSQKANAVLPILREAIHVFPQLTPERQTILSEWAAMATLSYDALSAGGCSIPQAVRNEFRKTGVLDENWAVWAAPYGGVGRHGTHRASYLYGMTEQRQPVFLLKTCGIAIGNLAIIALVSGTNQDLAQNWRWDASNRINRIFPVEDRSLIGTPPWIEDDEFERLCDRPVKRLEDVMQKSAEDLGVEQIILKREEMGY